jgi:hypothetical protein
MGEACQGMAAPWTTARFVKSAWSFIVLFSPTVTTPIKR